MASMVKLPDAWPFPDAVIVADPSDPPVIAAEDLTRPKSPVLWALRGNRAGLIKPPVNLGDIDDAPF